MFEFAPAPAMLRPSLWIGLGLWITGELLHHAGEGIDSAHRILGPIESVAESIQAVGW